jgi:hypothetical protein
MVFCGCLIPTKDSFIVHGNVIHYSSFQQLLETYDVSRRISGDENVESHAWIPAVSESTVHV